MIIMAISGEILSLVEISLVASTVFRGRGLSFRASFVFTEVTVASFLFRAVKTDS